MENLPPVVNRDAFMIWCEIAKLIDGALGLSMLADFDCARLIIDARDRQIASMSAPLASVILLRQAADLLVSLEPHLKTAPGSIEDQP